MENSLWQFLMRVSFRSKSEEIDDEDVRYYTTERCIEAGEEYNPELKWLDSESASGVEVNDDRSSGRGSGVEECSSGEYASPAIVCLKFVHPSGRGYAPDVGGSHGDVGDGLVGPGVPGGSSEEHLESVRATTLNWSSRYTETGRRDG